MKTEHNGDSLFMDAVFKYDTVGLSTRACVCTCVCVCVCVCV